MSRIAVVLIAGVALLPARGDAAPGSPPVRAAYCYHYMPVDHVDLLAAHGFDRAVMHFIADTLRPGDAAQLRAWIARGRTLGLEVVPQFLLEAPARLASRPAERRYTWGTGRVEPVACPLDSVYWRSALLDRAAEMLAAAPGVARIAVDLELMNGARRHYDAGPCLCVPCRAEFGGGAPIPLDAARRSPGLHVWEERRLAVVLERLAREFAARHPGVALEVFDLDFDSFVHRALARGLARAGVPTTSYCERSYSTGGASLPGARARLDALGLEDAPLVGGLWLKRFAPGALGDAVRSVLAHADGWFVFTTYSLWQEPARLTAPYTVPGAPDDYWAAMRAANAAP